MGFLSNFFSLGTILLSSCAATSMTRFFLMYKDDEQRQREAVGNALLGAVIGIGIFVFLMLINAYYALYVPAELHYFLCMIVSVCLFALFSMVLAYYRVKELLIGYFLIFCAQNLISIFLTVWGVHQGFGITAFFYSTVASLLIFMPLFIQLFMRYRSYSLRLLKEQLIYSVPLFAYSLIYMGFFTVDRFFIKHSAGYEALGTYALLWRFGTIFQFVAIALMDAWPIVLFNAQKEKNGDLLIGKLIGYLGTALTTMCLGIIVTSRCAIGCVFPAKYYFLCTYLVPFFIFVVFLELVKVFQSGFVLAAKTIYTPILVSCMLLIQSAVLYVGYFDNLTAVLLVNCAVMILYCALGYVLSRSVYSPVIYNVRHTARLALCFGMYLGVMQLLISLDQPWYWYCMLMLSWPICLVLADIIDYDARMFIKNLFFPTPPTSLSHNPTVLYLRTDVCPVEIKAGGSVAHTLGVVNGFINQGYDVIAASSAMPTLLRACKLKKFKELKAYPIFFFLRWKLYPLRWRLENIFSNFFFLIQLRSVTKNQKIDYVYQRYSLLNAVGIMISSWKKIPLILEYNGSEVWVFTTWADKTIFTLKRICMWVEKFNLMHAQHIVVVSQALKDELIGRGVDQHKILVCPNGVDTDLFNPHALENVRTHIRKELDIENKFVFGFIGTFSYWHGIELIEQMIPAVVAVKPNAHFLLIGHGPLKKQLQESLHKKDIAHHATFTGLVPQEVGKHYLAACDAFLCPTQPNPDGTRFFGSPTKMFEYLSMGRPVIASDLEQLAEIVHPSIKVTSQIIDVQHAQALGLLVAPTDIEGFIRAAIFLIDEKKEMVHSLGANARHKAVEQHSWNNHVRTIINFSSKEQ